jgi:hypothetical protein
MQTPALAAGASVNADIRRLSQRNSTKISENLSHLRHLRAIFDWLLKV